MTPRQAAPTGARCLVVAALFVPMAYLVALSFGGGAGGGYSLASYREGLSLASLPLLARSAALALGACLIALLLGGTAAAVFESRAFPLKGLVRTMALAPLLLPPVLQVAVWERLALPGGALASSLPFTAAASQPFPIRNACFAAWVLGLSYSPVLFFFACEGLRSVSQELVDAARATRGPWAVRFRVVAPLAAPAAIAGLGITFPLVFLNYEVPALLDVNTYPVLIHIEYGAWDDPGAAFAAALPAVALTLCLLLFAELWADRRGFAVAGRERGGRLDAGEDAPRPGPLAWALFGGWWGLAALLPLAVLISMAGRLSAFRAAFETDWEKIFWGTLVSGTTAVVAAVLAALLLLPPRSGRGSIRVFMWTLLAFPGSLLAFALINLCQSGPLFDLRDSWWILVVAGLMRFFPLAYFGLAAQLRAVPRAQWEAAELGPRWSRRWLRARLPLAFPGLAAGAAAVAIFSSQELAATVLLAPPGHEPLLVRIYNLLHYDPERDVLAALSIYHIATTLGIVGGIFLLGRLVGRR